MAKKASVPKRLAGVKIPKPLRRSLKEVAATQNGKALIAEALAAAGAALVASQARAGTKSRRLAARKAPKRKGAVGDGPAELSAAGEKLAAEARSLIEGLRSDFPPEGGPTPSPAGQA